MLLLSKEQNQIVMEYFLLYSILALGCGILGQYMAKEKNRSQGEGFAFGFFLGILGVIIIGLLPTKEAKEVVEFELTAEEKNQIREKQKLKEEQAKIARERAQVNQKMALIFLAILIAILILMIFIFKT